MENKKTGELFSENKCLNKLVLVGPTFFFFKN